MERINSIEASHPPEWLNKNLILAKVSLGIRPRKRIAKVTSKYQVTVPRTIAEKYHIRPGDDIDWMAAGEVIRVIPRDKQAAPEDRELRLRLFDQATERHRKRPSAAKGMSQNK